MGEVYTQSARILAGALCVLHRLSRAGTSVGDDLFFHLNLNAVLTCLFASRHSDLENAFFVHCLDIGVSYWGREWNNAFK